MATKDEELGSRLTELLDKHVPEVATEAQADLLDRLDGHPASRLLIMMPSPGGLPELLVGLGAPP